MPAEPFWHGCGERQSETFLVIFHCADRIIASVRPPPSAFLADVSHLVLHARVNTWTSKQMARPMTASGKFNFQTSIFCVAWQPNFMTNNTKGIIMYQNLPSSYWPMMNCVAWRCDTLDAPSAFKGIVLFSHTQLQGRREWLTVSLLWIKAHLGTSALVRVVGCF